jgi:DNA-binding IclR family transcriptional regulator
VHLSILDGAEVVYVDKIDSPEPVRAYSRIGGRSPAFAVATGKAMLAWQSPEYVAAVAERIERFTTRTVADAEELRQELARIRVQGFAVNKGEWRDTVCGLAAPIRDASGLVIAAVGISGPAERLKPKRLKELVAPVVEAAAVISASLGHGGAAEFNRLHTA